MSELPAERIVNIAKQVAGALDHAHSQGFIHRDIKPSNIMVEPDRNDHIIDNGEGISQNKSYYPDRLWGML